MTPEDVLNGLNNNVLKLEIEDDNIRILKLTAERDNLISRLEKLKVRTPVKVADLERRINGLKDRVKRKEERLNAT